jgi:hypothetical protein
LKASDLFLQLLILKLQFSVFMCRHKFCGAIERPNVRAQAPPPETDSEMQL